MKQQLANHLLEIGAVHLKPNDPFTWTSGIKSPIYCDNRLTLSFPLVRRKIAIGLEELIQTYYPEVDVIAGTATAGIPHAAWVSDNLNLPMVYVRGKAKEHGKGNQIEGLIKAGQNVVIVEDLISTGGSVITTAEALKESGANVLGVVAIFTYGLEKGTKQLSDAGLSYYTITDYLTLIDVANEKQLINHQDLAKLKKWRDNPASLDWLS
ncbi:orotate phosphoribosyltransferase [Anaerobacillus isosaccharinicus]|uniref:Orotate phosphoribosyltransferase n=1 Tax=Anaerobacillus isosaccharinicus TaxID=1532552 RepID=A0A1S2M7N3_9BACI|nr:orotate phosphoribosyltransferase [Anaerobacillus isosaccharinicus]MBA5587406.1 orotate phosphoribosyltransferase [Anaerobacillus isosaccharinicus]QOY34405.1 orotate phosphoribosyltransferase [Anaerobacillus isosaccharinicus]